MPNEIPQFTRLRWQLDSGEQTWPVWYANARVQGHTRLRITSPDHGLDTKAFSQAATQFGRFATPVFTRCVKFGKEVPWWPSKTRAGLPLAFNDADDRAIVHADPQRNIAQEMVTAAHDNGMRMIAYYWIHSDAELAEQHPEWICHALDGSGPIETPKGSYYLDITSSYREVILERLLELAEMGYDGLLFDHQHMPLVGCQTPALAHSFKQATGNALPEAVNMRDPIYRLFLEFLTYKVEETFAYWRKSVRAAFPEVVFLISTASLPSLSSNKMTTNLARLADSPKNEFNLALKVLHNSPNYNRPSVFKRNNDLAEPPTDIRLAFGWTLLRDSADNRPPRIWHLGSGKDPHHLLTYVSSLVSYGCVATVDVSERVLGGDWKGMRQNYANAFRFANQITPSFENTRPMRWAAVHFSEIARDAIPRLKRAWIDVLWPTIGAFEGFVREHLPVGVVNDFQLAHGQLDGYKVIFVVDRANMPQEQRDALVAFERQGGKVLENDPSWAWHSPAETTNTLQAFRKYLRSALAAANIKRPVFAKCDQKRLHAVYHQDQNQGRMVVALSNNFTYIIRRRKKGEVAAPPPAPLENVRLIVPQGSLPSRVYDVINDQSLQPVARGNGGYRIDVPAFQSMGLIEIVP